MYKLNKQEISCLKLICKRKRIDYLQKNKYTYLEDDIDLIDEARLVTKENIEDEFIKKNDLNIKVEEIEKVFGNPNVLKSTKNLTYKEKLVLFSCFWENKTDKQIGKELHIKPNTITKMKKRAMEKIRNKYRKLKEEKRNVF